MLKTDYVLTLTFKPSTVVYSEGLNHSCYVEICTNAMHETFEIFYVVGRVKRQQYKKCPTECGWEQCWFDTNLKCCNCQDLK